MEPDMMQGGWAVETCRLTKRFGDRTAVDQVDLRVPAGTAFGYLGPNGAGKTTLIRMLLGLTRPTAGSMRLLGHPVPRERSAALQQVGAMAEEPRFLDHLTGRENLRVNAAAREPAALGRIEAALERVGLRERAGERVARYSTGMRQRLGVARCLLADPELLILDEPANGLDPAGIAEFRQMIRALVAEGRTVMLSSHLLDEVEKVCDAAAIVDEKTKQVLPQLGSVALQSGEHAGKAIAQRLAGKEPKPFKYKDKGTMAAIGRGAAVMQMQNGRAMTGRKAQIAWLGVHMVLLPTNEDRAKAIVDWAGAGISHQRVGRIKVGKE